MMHLSSNSSSEVKQCIVNDQMVPFTVLYTLLFLGVLPGNLLSLWAVINLPRLKHSISVYLVNLLTSDLLLLLALPVKLLIDTQVAPWGLKVFHCQVSSVATYISLYAAIAFIALITLDRHLQESQSLRSLRLQGRGFSALLSLLVWILLLVIMVPNMALPTQEVQVRRYLSCSSLKSDLGLQWHALTVFLCTALFLNAAIVVLLCVGLSLRRLLFLRRQRQDSDPRRWARSAVAVALVFLLSFVPYHAVRTPYTLTQTRTITSCSTTRSLFLWKEATLLLSALRLFYDPLLFLYLHPPLRRVVISILPFISRHIDEGNTDEEEQEEQGEKQEGEHGEEEEKEQVEVDEEQEQVEMEKL